MRAIWVRLCTIVVVIGILTTGCGTATLPASEQADTNIGETGVPTVEEVYRGLEQTLKRPGYVFHSTIGSEMPADPSSASGTNQIWINAERDVAREEISPSPANRIFMKSTSIIANGKQYRLDPHGEVSELEPIRCHGASAVISLVLGCPGPIGQWTTTVETGRYDGKPTIVLVTSGTVEGPDGRANSTGRRHLETDTYLPIALEHDVMEDHGETKTTVSRGTGVFTNEFVPADSLPGNFFDPASIGYVEHDPADQLRATHWGIPVYWLDQLLDRTGDLPPLILGSVEVPDYPGPGYQFNLNYHSADDPYGPPVLTIEEWSQADWDANDAKNRAKMPPSWENPCWEREVIELTDGRATIFSGFTLETLHAPAPDGSSSEAACPKQPHDQFIAQVEFGPTFLFIQAPGGLDQNRSPYDTREGMEAAARALRPFKGGS